MNNPQDDLPRETYIKRRRISDFAGGAGMVLIAVGLLIPLFQMTQTSMLSICKWVYTAGVLLFLGSKCVKVYPPSASFRLRRLKRLEFWAGVCFMIGAGFWFYNQSKFAGNSYAGSLSVIHDTILFSLSGAVIQLLAAWLIYFREKKEARMEKEEREGGKKKCKKDTTDKGKGQSE